MHLGKLHDLTLPGKLNNTPKADVDIIFFNRVPKVGSQTLMALLYSLSQHNNFKATRDKVQNTETIMLTPSFETDLVKKVLAIQQPASFSKHVAYIDFEMLAYPKPIYINMVRDPVERLISWFYYIRTSWYRAERSRVFSQQYKPPSAGFLQKDFSTCVLGGDPECTFIQNSLKGLGDHRRQVLFFCGQDAKVCMPFNSHEAMQRAKRNVETKYSVVGSWEDTNITLTVLEKYIPRFFSGAAREFYKAEDYLQKKNHNSLRPPITEEVRKILSKNLTNEIEFYQFCKQRLYKQYLAIYLSQQDSDNSLKQGLH